MSFTPPKSFIEKSEARQAKLREKKASSTPPSSTLTSILSIEEARKSRRERNSSLKNEYEGLDADEKNYRIFDSLLRDERGKFQFDQVPRKVGKVMPITVCVRKRRLNAKETANRNLDIATVDPNNNIYIHEPRIKLNMERAVETHKFTFDHAFDQDVTNATIYKNVVKSLVDTMFQGGKVLLFAYGQTGKTVLKSGSGKTYTIFGDDSNPGVYLAACHDMVKKRTRTQKLIVRFFEIYSGKVFDLFNQRNRVQLLEDAKGNALVVGLIEKQVESFHEFKKLVEIGRNERTTGVTEANSTSSRSHAVFQILLHENEDLVGQFTFVDLAGSERGSETGNISRQARIEGAEINKSLLALKECIRSLYRLNSTDADQSVHVPFRGSKLTQILRESFMGKLSKTVMVATIGPGSLNAEHTLNTLRYADRVKELKAKRPVKISGRGRNNEGSDENDGADEEDSLSPLSDDELQFKADEDVGLNDTDDAYDDRPSDQEEIVSSVQEVEKDDDWLKSREIIEKHSASVDQMLKILKQEEKLLRDLLNDEVSLADYCRNLRGFLSKRIDETRKVYDTLMKQEG